MKIRLVGSLQMSLSANTVTLRLEDKALKEGALIHDFLFYSHFLQSFFTVLLLCFSYYFLAKSKWLVKGMMS